MKLFKTIITGMGLYIGWQIAEAIDVELDKRFGCKLDAITKKICKTKEPEKREPNMKVVMGFQAD